MIIFIFTWFIRLLSLEVFLHFQVENKFIQIFNITQYIFRYIGRYLRTERNKYSILV